MGEDEGRRRRKEKNIALKGGGEVGVVFGSDRASTAGFAHTFHNAVAAYAVRSRTCAPSETF